MKHLFSVAVAVALTLGAPGIGVAQVATKSARTCAQEYKARKPNLVGAQRHRADFIALCRLTAVGVPTPSDPETAASSDPEVSHPEVDYKSGYMFTPAYLSSPQVFDWLRHGPN